MATTKVAESSRHTKYATDTKPMRLFAAAWVTFHIYTLMTYDPPNHPKKPHDHETVETRILHAHE